MNLLSQVTGKRLSRVMVILLFNLFSCLNIALCRSVWRVEVRLH